MSVDLCVYLRGERLPTNEVWQAAINTAGIRLTLDKFDTRDLEGFLPCSLNGIDCGFEYYFHAVEDQDQGLRGRIGDADRVVTLILHGGEMNDLKAAMYAAAALTEVSGGTFYDPQSDMTAVGKGVYELIRQDEEHERERGRLAAAKDAAITDNRCHHCAAPCPAYRKTCMACGKPIGGGEHDGRRVH